jgi:hypothetical protein
LALGLSVLAARLEPKDASGPAASLTHALSKTTDYIVLMALAQALSAVGARLDPQEATAAIRQATASLNQAMSKARPNELRWLGGSLSAVAARLEPKEATTVCRQAAVTLTQAMSKEKDPELLAQLAEGLSAVATRLEPQEAAVACGRAATTLSQAMSTTTTPRALQALAEGLSALAARLEPREAQEAAASLTQAMSKTTYPDTLAALVQGLSAVAARLEPQEAAAACGQAATTITQAMSKNPYSSSTLQPLAQSLSVVIAGMDLPSQRQRVRALVAALGIAVNGTGPLSPLPLLYPAAEPPPRLLSTAQFVDLLKGPLCVGEARRVVLAALEGRYRRPFATKWEFARFVEEQDLEKKLGFSLTSPPQPVEFPAVAPASGRP